MRIEAVHVVIPAHDEAELLGRCLTSISAAATRAEQTLPGLSVQTLVVLDACTDRSSQIAAAAGVDVLVVDDTCVGAARAAGVRRVAELQAAYGRDPARVWVANTDADSVVPETWLVDQLRLAEQGRRLVVGAVLPEPDGLAPALRLAWARLHTQPQEHVHGANLGVCLAAYLRVGGFDPLPEHEDVVLVRRLRAAGEPWTTGTTVLTSARNHGRTSGGFAGFLRALAGEPG